MKKSLIALTVMVLLLAFAPQAQAQSSRLYLAGYMGLLVSTKGDFSENTTALNGDASYKNAMTFAGAIGLRLTPRWRVEAEVSQRSLDLENINYTGTAGPGSVSNALGSWLYMANVYYDFDYNWRNIMPFLTAGFGLVSHDGKIFDSTGTMPNATGTSLGFAWQAGGGLKYRVKPNMAFSGGYRYVAAGEGKVDSYNLDFRSHELRLGLEYDIPVGMFK